MLTTIKYVLLTALRDKLFFALVACMLLAVILSRLLGSTALIEPTEMTIAFATASSRLILVLGMVVFVCFNIRNAFESREIDVMLSRPISRGNLVIAYQFGFSLVSLLLIIATCAMISIQGIAHWKGFAMWSASLFLELVLVVALSLFSGFTLRSAVSAVMMTLGFYVLARMMGFFMITAANSVPFESPAINMMIRKSIEYVSMVIPRLDFFADSDWIIYGAGKLNHGIHEFVLQAGIYIPLLLAAAIADFRRKQF